MHKLSTLSLVLIFSLSFTTAYGVVSSFGYSLEKDKLTAEKFVQLSAKEFGTITNQKLGWKQKMVLKYTQHQIKKQLTRGESIGSAEEMYYNNSSRFSLGGFLLGFFLGLIGVLIAILFGRNAVRSALIGLLCLIIVGLLWWLI